MADNIRRDLVFDTGGRPYNNRDFESIQNALNDIKSIFEGFINKNSDANSSIFNKSAWVVKWYSHQPGMPYYPGESVLIWLDGEFRFIEDSYYSGGYTSSYYIIPENTVESRLYKDGNVKPVFNLYSAKWITEAEFNQLNPTPTAYMKFSSYDDMKNAQFEYSTFVNSVKVLSVDGGSTYNNITNEITFVGENGFSIYKGANNTIRFKQFTSDTSLPDANRVVITTANKTLTTSSITTTELGYLNGVTSNIQTQLDDKLESVSTNDILDNAVTASKIATGAITTNKLANDSVTSDKLDTNITIAGDLIVQGTIQCSNDITAFANVFASNNPNPTYNNSIQDTNWHNLTGFTSDYESDQNNPAKYRIDYDGNVYFSGIVKRKTNTIKSGEIWAVLPDDLNPATQTNIRFNISGVQLDEFIFSTLTFDGTNFNASVEILGKTIDEPANTINAFYLDGITYNKLY